MSHNKSYNSFVKPSPSCLLLIEKIFRNYVPQDALCQVWLFINFLTKYDQD